MNSEIPESWFSNPRPLPLDEHGRVDFSRDNRMVKTQPVQPNPATAERFMGRMFHAVSLPDGGRIIQLYRWDESDPDLPLATANHNIFRLDAAGNVVWQVRRVESPTRASWEKLHELARQRYAEGRLDSAYGPEGYWDPFTSIYIVHCPPAQTGEPQNMVWQPGCKVYLNTRTTDYLLDIHTGIATGTGEQLK